MSGAIDEDVSVFIYDKKSGDESALEMARNAVKSLKTLRHPSILTYFDSLEASYQYKNCVSVAV